MKIVLLKLSVAILIISFLWGCKKTHKKLPNIILMVADDLGYSDLSCYRENIQKMENPPTCQTPYIDNLAKNGMRFTSFYSGAAVCSPSRSALMTGRNKTRLGIYNWIPDNVPMHLRNEETTIAEMLKQNGYATGHFGKWHLTSANMSQPEPLDQGFDYAFWTHNNANPSHQNPVNFIRNRNKTGELKGYSSHLVVQEAKEWLDKQKGSKKPFYMNVWFHEPHLQQAAPDSLKNRHKKNKAYYGCIENMDYAIGKLMRYLKENKLDENTIILYTSDNGSKYPGSNDPFRGKKVFQYEGGIRVPFIAYWKGKIPKRTTSNTVGHFTDVLPTIAAFTKSEVPKNKIVDGENLSNVFTGNDKSYRRKAPLFFYRYFHDPICMLRQDDMVLLGYWKKPKPKKDDYNEVEEALFKPTNEEPWSQWSFQKSHMEVLKKQEPKYFELYNIKNDEGQRIDIAAENPEITENMKQTMLIKRKEMVNEGGDWYEKK